MSRLNTIDKAMICFNVQLVKILQCKITVCKVIIVFSRGGILITSLHIIALLRKVFFRCIIIFFRTFETKNKVRNSSQLRKQKLFICTTCPIWRDTKVSRQVRWPGMFFGELCYNFSFMI